ncbi:MAG TPA: hypothetical protein PLJ60_08680 [Chryseolinea sp.]|nr:hypothetical protein [Chryseolinea sp.]HPH46749.1 hypothetical protein [Chryseolinea sp.]HPM30401.1 hypothetical protein [Chryseolinea sp.]
MGTLSGFLEYKIIKKTFNKYPFDQLTKWGFREVPLNEESNWTLTMVKLVGYFDGYPILCKAEDGLLKVIAITRKEMVNDMHVAELKLKFGESKILYDWSGIGMSYTAKGDTLLTFGQMESELKELVKYFNERGIESSEMTAVCLGIKA